jgi:hypothetical protein
MKTKENNIEKPSHEAKALSLFLMAYKTIDPVYKERSKRINRLWDLVKSEELSREAYEAEVKKMLKAYGGYSQVIEKTILYYIDKTGSWQVKGDDKYCEDARLIAERITNR